VTGIQNDCWARGLVVDVGVVVVYIVYGFTGQAIGRDVLVEGARCPASDMRTWYYERPSCGNETARAKYLSNLELQTSQWKGEEGEVGSRKQWNPEEVPIDRKDNKAFSTV